MDENSQSDPHRENPESSEFRPKSNSEPANKIPQPQQTPPPDENIPAEEQQQPAPAWPGLPDLNNKAAASAPEEKSSMAPRPASQKPEPQTPPQRKVPDYVLPPQKYLLKTMLLFTDFFLIFLYFYFFMIRSIVQDVRADTFSFLSNRVFAFYCLLIITLAAGVLIMVFKVTHSAATRFKRENEVRQDPNLKVWLVGFDWGWPMLFFPTMVLMVGAGLLGIFLEAILPDTAAATIQAFLGGVVILFGSLNAAVVIFKLKPVTLGLIIGAFLVFLLILLLHGPQTFIGFFRGFRHLGIKIEPLGYILLAYIWSIFLRIIWVKSFFFYWVFVPNRLELQHGLSESNDSVDREDLRLQIDTDDVILRWWNVGIITFYFPELDRLPITNVVWGIRKKALYANRIASVKTMQD